ncbi:hypothetical protein ISTM_89 [Insectomime virus]|uniref:Uncharacterized protein n=1 Tax=Tunisvirus fontaine2 TaxID=1421067 RepID=V9SGQ8_9VIRU|nr:hypothetical protein D1R32_gp235 [Tunisvirus fontaine2]AHA45987.1 hypothetical protein ISTM_89 [Insectomime virus]AHC54952.1 hypothetical protein TNS_ORF234 [Tunisvirus fontaine2]
MDTFKVAHIATEIAVIGGVYVVLKRKVDHEKAEREALATKVQKLEETVKQQMEALKILYSRLEKANAKPQKPRKTKGAGVFRSDTEEENEKEEEVTIESDYHALEDDEYEKPEHRIGSSSLDETD